jgi:ribosomal protein S18 acetylase RimI-like enzyme
MGEGEERPLTMRIRLLEEADLAFAVEQTGREGWDSTAAAFRLCLAHDPEGCHLVEVDGRRAGMITTSRYPGSAWLGNLIVAPFFRRQGVGEELMRHALERLEAGGARTLWLEGDPMGIELYRRLGFADRFESPRFLASPPHLSPAQGSARDAVEPLQPADLDALRAFDAPRFGDDRGRLLELLLRIARAAYAVREEQDIVGYAMALPSAAGVRLGPCVARDERILGLLVDALCADFPAENVVLAVPGTNRAAQRLYEERGFVRTPSSLRMLRGEDPGPQPHAEVAALTNGAMG